MQNSIQRRKRQAGTPIFQVQTRRWTATILLDTADSNIPPLQLLALYTVPAYICRVAQRSLCTYCRSYILLYMLHPTKTKEKKKKKKKSELSLLLYHTAHTPQIHARNRSLLCRQVRPRGAYALSPRMRRASWMSLGMMVTRFAWMAHRLVSSNSPTCRTKHRRKTVQHLELSKPTIQHPSNVNIYRIYTVT